MIIFLPSELSPNRAFSLGLANAPYLETTTTRLKAQTTFVNSCSNVDWKPAKRPLPVRVQCEDSRGVSNRRRYRIKETRLNTVTGVELSVGSIPVIGGIYLWILRRRSCGLSVRASILPESYQRGLQRSE